MTMSSGSAGDAPATTALAAGSVAYRRLTLAMLFAGFATFSTLYAVQPLLPLLAAHYALSAEAASLSARSHETSRRVPPSRTSGAVTRSSAWMAW